MLNNSPFILIESQVIISDSLVFKMTVNVTTPVPTMFQEMAGFYFLFNLFLFHFEHHLNKDFES